MTEETPTNPETEPAGTGAASGDGGQPPPSESPASAPPEQSAAPAAAPEGGGTDDAPLIASEGGEDPPAQAPADWPANWRDIMAGGDEKLLQRLNRFQSPINLMKSWAAAQSKIGAGEVNRAKPEGREGDPEYQRELDEWRASAGIPTEPDGYLEKLPDGIVVGDEDKDLASNFLSAMHKADAPPALVHQALAWHQELKEKQAAERVEQDRSHRVQAEEELRAEWGPEFRPTINGIQALLDYHGGDGFKDRLFGARMPDGTLFGDDPSVLKFLAALDREINPHGTVVPNAGQTPLQTVENELAALRKEMTDRNSDYYKNEAKQARYRELLDMEGKIKGRAA